MEARYVALLILLPFILVFVYAAFHEIRRYRSQGKATYGLVYDEETGTTHLTGIEDASDSYDIGVFDPNDYRDPDQVEPEPEDQDAEQTDDPRHTP